MKNHKVLRGLSILLIVASLLMLTGGWVTLKKEYRRELSSVLNQLDGLVDEAESMFYWYGLDGTRNYKDLMRKIEKTRDKAIDILEDGALSLSEGRYLLGKTTSLLGDFKSMLKKADLWDTFKRDFEDIYGPLSRAKMIYTVFFAATLILSILAGVLHILKKKHSGIPALIFFLIWTIAALLAVGYLNKEAFYSDVLAITAIPILAPLCMLASVVLWKIGYKAYKEEANAPAPAVERAPEAAAIRPDVNPVQGKFCVSCGRAIPSGSAKFCPGCGTALSDVHGGSEAAHSESSAIE